MGSQHSYVKKKPLVEGGSDYLCHFPKNYYGEENVLGSTEQLFVDVAVTGRAKSSKETSDIFCRSLLKLVWF